MLLSIIILLVLHSVVIRNRCPSCKTAAQHPYPCFWPSQQFHCSSTCGQCCWASNLQLWTPGSLAAADGPLRWGPPGAGSRPAAGRTVHPCAGRSLSPAALQCDAAAAPGSPPAVGGRERQLSDTLFIQLRLGLFTLICTLFVLVRSQSKNIALP